jgi:hypothetical protein
MENEGVIDNASNGMPPKNYMVESILVTLFCCLPFGIVGIVNASKVESHFVGGRIDEANRYAAEAKKWTKIGFFSGLAVGVIYVIAMVVGGVATTM